MTSLEALFKIARVRRELDNAIARAIDEDRDSDYDNLVHALESFDDIANTVLRRIEE